jgi:hypothetical protein
VRDLVIDEFDDTELTALKASAERIIARIDDPRRSMQSTGETNTQYWKDSRERAEDRNNPRQHPTRP